MLGVQSCMKTIPLFLAAMISAATASSAPEAFTNSLGMRMVPIPAGTFRMGETNPTPGKIFEVAGYLRKGDWDEHPVHEVTISKPFYMADAEVTAEQFRQFRATFEGNAELAPAASGVSWHDAVAFCEWLSRKEGRHYRLPTEAEWEYAARAGTSSLFSGGDKRPAAGEANPWGLKHMHDGVAEWCLDWHGEYPVDAQTDPVGPSAGFAKVVRGGGLDKQSDYYARSANRAGMPPDFPPVPIEKVREMTKGEASAEGNPEGVGQKRSSDYKSEFLYKNFTRSVLGNQGNHPIGFRVVAAPDPAGRARVVAGPYPTQGVRQAGPEPGIGPDMARPWFRKRYLLPTPPENTDPAKMQAFRALGWPRGFLRHMHSPGLEVCSNGDVLFISFTAVSETDPDVALLSTRLRFGADEWDPPDLFLDFPDVDDHAPMLWNDRGRLWFFWGANKLDSGFPFQWMTSDDNGATWSDVHFPLFKTPVGGHSAQPITMAFRDAAGRIYVASDAIGPESVLWQSDDDGATWIDPAGRSGGRHTAFVLLRDGRILGMGGKSSNIDGFMPRSISSDGGRTYTVSKTIFPHLGSNQRPSLIRLASGRLFMAGDLQSNTGVQPKGYTERGCYAALSDDEGETWTMRTIPGTQMHERPENAKALGGPTLGYSVARQAPNGVIHLISTMTEPCLHFEMNEAWILHGADLPKADAALRANSAKSIRHVQEHVECDEAGRVRQRYSGGIGDDGRFLLHGAVAWFYPDGKLQREATYELGRLTGSEKYYSPEGRLVWERDHQSDGDTTWTNYWPDGGVRTRSTWRDMHAEGEAVLRDPSGKQVYSVRFEHGVPVSSDGDPGEY